MNLITIIGISVSLAMDAFSVCIASGVKISKPDYHHYFRLAFHFGLFQFFMPIAGFYGGVLIQGFIETFSHWIAFFLLSFIGIKMIWESFQLDKHTKKCDPSRGKTLIFLALATSIDAAAVGFSFAALGTPIFFPSIMIGLICFLFSIFGLFIGSKIGSKIGKWAEILGGIILIGIGIKILLENLN